MAKNRLEISDIDNEDDLIFADDDDSLSSTGLCGTGVRTTSSAIVTKTSTEVPLSATTTVSMTSCLVAKLQRTSCKGTKSCVSVNTISPINESDVSCSRCTGLELSGMAAGPVSPKSEIAPQPSQNLAPPVITGKKFSSMSDIEPDENIVSEMLVKTPPSTTRKNSSSSDDR